MPRFGRLNPARETPVLELDDGSALVQSAAILWFLAEGTALLPQDPLERAQVVRWLQFEQDWVMSGVGAARFYTLTGRNPGALPKRVARGRTALDMLERDLAGRSWIVGDRPSIADLALFAYAHVAPDAGIDLEPWPAVRAWIGRIEALPGFMDDYVPYPANARPGAGRSIYDGGN